MSRKASQSNAANNAKIESSSEMPAIPIKVLE